jgi:hypothetical protein
MKSLPHSAGRPRQHSWRIAWPASLAALVLVGAVWNAAWAGKVSYMGPPQKANAADCDRCNVQADFASRMRDCGASMEFIELKNGTGIVYSVADPRMVPKLQKNVEWVKDELAQFSKDPDHFKLCTYCKASHRIYSKIDREVSLTSNGAIFLMRSSDPDAQHVLHEIYERSRQEQTDEALRAAPSR